MHAFLRAPERTIPNPESETMPHAIRWPRFTSALLMTGAAAFGYLLSGLQSSRPLVAQPRADSGAVSDQVTARQFLLVDESGNTRGELSIGPDDGPALIIYDKKGQRRARFSVTGDDQPGLLFWS